MARPGRGAWLPVLHKFLATRQDRLILAALLGNLLRDGKLQKKVRRRMPDFLCHTRHSSLFLNQNGTLYKVPFCLAVNYSVITVARFLYNKFSPLSPESQPQIVLCHPYHHCRQQNANCREIPPKWR